jgi:hypothetical protein
VFHPRSRTNSVREGWPARVGTAWGSKTQISSRWWRAKGLTHRILRRTWEIWTIVRRLARPRGRRALIGLKGASPRREGRLSSRKRATMTMKRKRSMRMKKMKTRVIRNRIVGNSNSKCHKNNKRKNPSHHHPLSRHLMAKKRSQRKCLMISRMEIIY